MLSSNNQSLAPHNGCQEGVSKGGLDRFVRPIQSSITLTFNTLGENNKNQQLSRGSKCKPAQMFKNEGPINPDFGEITQQLCTLINDNLEAMAKQLYDYWFVQFDFPNEEGKPYKSSGGAMVWNEKLKREIPEEWKTANVFDELSVQYGFPFSTELFTEEPTNIPVVRIRDILENSVSAYSEEEVDEKYKLQKQDLLVGMDGNFHMNYWNDNVSYLNQRSVRLRAKSKSAVSIMQAKYDIATYIKAKELRAKGSTVGHLSDKDLKELFVLVSPNADFRNKFDSILAEIIENRCEMIELTKQRDELLPLLMNGQASVNYHLSDD